MTSHEMLTTYESLSTLMDSMLDAASQGEWDHLATLEARCQSYVGSLMQAAPIALNETEQRSRIAIIRNILQNDARIRAYTEPRMHELQQRLSIGQAGHRTVQAYNAQRL